VSAPAHLFTRLYNWSLPLEREALRIAVDLVDVHPGERMLDVATGTGALPRELASRGACRAQVIGLDHSRSMLSGTSGIPTLWGIVVADARALPFADASFDVITLSYLLHLLRAGDRTRVLEATRRALRPGGRVVTVTIDSQHPALRWLLDVVPAWTSLRRLDPRSEMHTAGLRPVHARYTATGWPSLCVLAKRD
jgi:demethylmenaquinone methyltransferase / 2-methoxy-6-polyprenyl-1,4-benzoquinol methylase